MPKPGDIVFYVDNPDNLIEDAIVLFSKAKHKIVHVALWVAEDKTMEANFGELVGYATISQYTHKGNKHIIKSLPSLTDAQRQGILDYAHSKFGQRYDLPEDIKIGLEDTFGIHIPYTEVHRKICSTLVWDAYEAVGIKLYPEHDCSPEDLFDCPALVLDN